MDMEPEIITKPLSELPDDLDFFSEGKWPKNWGYGSWDADHVAITNVLEDGTQIRYPLPKTLISIMRRERQFGADEIRSQMRGMLGIED